MNKEDIIKFYKLHGHKNNSNFRAINRQKSDDITNKNITCIEELITCCETYKNLDLYLMLNEPKEKGQSGDDVLYFNGICIDIEGINHKVEEKPKAKELADLVINYLNQNKIKTNLKDSGRGYEISIYLDEPVLINNEEERTKIKTFYQRIKNELNEKFSIPGAEIDTSTLEIARVHRIAGTTNQASKTLSTMLEIQGTTPTLIIRNWIQSLKEPEAKQITSTEIPEICNLCEKAFIQPFPNGKRHMKLSPNVAKYIETKPKQKQQELKEKYYQQQWSNGTTKIRDAESENWKDHLFNCFALQKYAKQINYYEDTCLNCPHRKKLLKETRDANENQEYVTNYESINFEQFKPYLGKTEHLLNYELADSMFPLNGEQYLTTKKQMIYLTNSLIQPPIRFEVGQFSFDNRIHLLIFTPPGQGKSTIDFGLKNNLKNIITIKDAGYTSHVEQLKGTITTETHGRGKEKVEELVEHDGILANSDLVTFDESYDLLNESNSLNADSMRTIRKACDTYLENEITKPQVKYAENALRFNSKARIMQTVHPRKFKSNIFIVSGSYRRFFASEIKPKDINIKDSTNGLKQNKKYADTQIQEILKQQYLILKKNNTLILSDEAIDEAIEWIDATNEFLVYNPNQSIKYLGLILYKPIKHYFFKCIAIHALSKQENIVSVKTTAEACCDAFEFLLETLETYSRWNDIAAGANPWGTADPKQSLVLDWMLSKGAMSKGESNITTEDVKTCISKIYGVHDRQAASYWIAMKKSGLVKSMDKTPFKAWLALHPYFSDDKKNSNPEFADAMASVEEICQNNASKNNEPMQPMQCFFKIMQKLQKHDLTYYNNLNKEFKTDIFKNCIVDNSKKNEIALAASDFSETSILHPKKKTALTASDCQKKFIISEKVPDYISQKVCADCNGSENIQTFYFKDGSEEPLCLKCREFAKEKGY